MAARENQGLQAIVITLTILVLLLGVGLLLVNNARKTAVASAKDASDRATRSSSDQAKAQSESETYKQWIGFATGDAYDALQKRYDDDMKKYGANVDEQSRKYATLLDNVYEENRKLVQNEANAKQEVKALSERLAAVEAQKEQQVKKFKEEMDKAKQELAGERTKFEEQYASINAENDKIADELKQMQKKHDDEVAKMQKEKTDQDTSVVKLERSIEKYKEQLPGVDPFAQPADGQITWVDQAHRTVWLNLGSADGLRPQTTFSVATEGLDDAQKAEKKGTIEVTRVTDAHLSEARITSDEDINPLLPGDRVYSLVWDRGRQVGFAIAGIVDMNGDGREDLDKLKAVIAANNGRVDAAPDATGKQQGEVQVDTRYLILGKYPGDAAKPEFLKSWKSLSEEAASLGVETIALEEFLPLIGWRIEARSVPLGPTATAKDFPATKLDDPRPRKPQQPTGVFKKRLSPVTY